jgi:hypothetical protein
VSRLFAEKFEVEIMLYCPSCYELLDDAYEPCQKCGRKAAPFLPNEKDRSDRSQPLPRFASYAELVNPNAKSKKKYLVVAVLAALLLLAREGGFVNGYLFRINADSKTQIPLYGNQYIRSGDRATYTELSKVVDSTFNTKGNRYGLGFQMFGASPLVVDLQEEIQNNLKKQTQISANVEEVALTGLYWLPFFKSGSCKYRVSLQFVGKDSIVYTGVLDGVTDFDSSGICSMRTLKQTLGDEIATRVVKSVDDVIRK